MSNNKSNMKKNRKMLHQDRPHRGSLTLIFTGIVLGSQLITVIIVGIAMYLLAGAEIISGLSASMSSTTSVLLFFALFSLVVGFLTAFILSRVLLKPVNMLINSMNRLAQGDYRVRLAPSPWWSRQPFVAEICGSFNRMAEELENTEVLRSDFVNNFSHEFKTPIVSIAGFAKLLLRGRLSDEQKKEYLAVIEEESLRLSEMATNVLNLTRVESQTILTDTKCFNLSEQLRSCVLLLSRKWEKKALDIDFEMDEYNVTASEELLKQVWINLLDNAIKFAPPHGVIAITAAPYASRLSVSIANSGSSIPRDKREKIFNKFYQADESHATEGNGVGLAIVKRVVELHEGSVEVESKDDRTVFTVNLPWTSN